MHEQSKQQFSLLTMKHHWKLLFDIHNVKFVLQGHEYAVKMNASAMHKFNDQSTVYFCTIITTCTCLIGSKAKLNKAAFASLTLCDVCLQRVPSVHKHLQHAPYIQRDKTLPATAMLVGSAML